MKHAIISKELQKAERKICFRGLCKDIVLLGHS